MKRLGLAVLALAGVVFAGPYDAWSNYRIITVNTTAGGANVTTDQANFPLLVRLTNASSATGADVLTGSLTTGGADVRFTDSTGATSLSFQQERWTAGAAEFWVKVPTVSGNGTTKIRMYWGRAAQTTASSGAAVFDTANDWRVVYHMNGGAGALTESDATINGITMSASDSVAGAVPGDTVGMIGPARTFTGDSLSVAGRQYMVASSTAANPVVNITANSPYSVSAWAYARAITYKTGSGNSIFNKGDKEYAMQVYGNVGVGAKQFESATYTSTYRQAKSKGTTLAAAGQWYHITGTWTGGANGTNGTGKMYVNGVLDSTSTLAIGTAAPDQTYNMFIGANPSSGTVTTAPGTTRTLAAIPTTVANAQNPRFWNGYLDEITLSRNVRSDDWVKLTYETQKAGVTAVVLGSTQVGTPLPPALRYVPTNTAATDTLPIMMLNEPATVAASFSGFGAIDSVRIIGTATLPTGLTFNGATGAITGTPTAAFTAANRTIKAWSGTDTASRVVRITAAVGPLAFTMSRYTQDTAVYTLGAPVANGPSYTGRTPTSFTVTPSLPAGLTLDAASGVIGGRATAAVAAANYTVKGVVAANLVRGADSSSRVVRITTSGTADDYTTWTRHRTIWLNTSATTHGAAIAGTIRNFPILVRLANDTVVTQALAAGADIRFSKADGTTPLPYEIENWDATGKNATIWVLADTILANNATQTIQMHWGKTGATSQSSGPAVFSNANGFQSVVHMNAGNTGNEKDASTRNFATTAFGAPKDTVGLIGRARAFDGATQYMQIVNSATGPLNHQLNEDLTLSAWANLGSPFTTSANGYKLIEKSDQQYTLAVYNAANPKFWEITIKANGQYVQCTSGAPTTGNNTCTGGTTVVQADTMLNAWHHVVGIYKGNGLALGNLGGTFAESLYVDGALVNNRTFNLTSSTTRTEGYNVNIGAMVTNNSVTPDGGGTFERFFLGLLDEARIENVARSADWAKLEYENQKAAQNFVRFAVPTTAVSHNLGRVAARQALSFEAVGSGILFSIQGAGVGDKATLNLVDMWGRTVFSGNFLNGEHLTWNGLSSNGQNVSAGIYIARVTLTNAQTKLHTVLEHKVPFTR